MPVNNPPPGGGGPHAHIAADITGTAVLDNDARLTDARTPTAHDQAISTVTNLQTELDGKQASLVSGTNIKTINGSPVLGSGDLAVSASIPVRVLTADLTLPANGYVVVTRKMTIPSGIKITINSGAIMRIL